MKKTFNLCVVGATSLSGAKMFMVSDRGTTVRIPYDDITDHQAVKRKLAAGGIHVLTKEKLDALYEEVERITVYDEQPLVDRPGWNKGYFCLPDGTIFTPDGAAPGILAFDPDTTKCEKSGSGDEWLQGVVQPLAGQALPAFVMQWAYMPTLLPWSERDDNFGFEIVGKPGTGKSTLQVLAASVLGSARYVVSFHITLNGLEEEIPMHAYLPLMLEEANLHFAGETKAKRGAAFKALAFMMSSGRQKGRFKAPAGPAYRFSYLSSTNEPLASLIGEGTDVAKAAGDRLITLEIDPQRSFGVFDHLPDDVGSASEFAQRLRNAATANHGYGIRRFAKKLVSARSKDEDALRADIARWVEAFRIAAGVDLNDGSQVRVANGYGLVYAAGRLGTRYGVFPKGWDSLAPVLACYSTFRRTAAPTVSFDDRLRAIARDVATVDLKTAGDRQIAAGMVFKRDKKQHSELIVRSADIDRVFPNWRFLKSQPDVAACIVSDEGRVTTKRKLSTSGAAERVYCFKLDSDTEEADGTLFDV